MADDPHDSMMPPTQPKDAGWEDYMQENENPAPHGMWMWIATIAAVVVWGIILSIVVIAYT